MCRCLASTTAMCHRCVPGRMKLQRSASRSHGLHRSNTGSSPGISGQCLLVKTPSWITKGMSHVSTESLSAKGTLCFVLQICRCVQMFCLQAVCLPVKSRLFVSSWGTTSHEASYTKMQFAEFAYHSNANLAGSWNSLISFSMSFKICSSSSHVSSGAIPPLLFPMLIAPLVGWNRKPTSLHSTN